MAAIDQYLTQSRADRDRAIARGDEIYLDQRDRSRYYNQNEEGYRQQGDEAYNQLRDTPGYTDEEARGIGGDPNAAFKYYNPDELTADMERGNADVFGAGSAYGGGVRDAAGRTGTNLRGAAAGNRTDLYGAADDLGTGVRGAAQRAKGNFSAPTDDQLSWQGGVYNYMRGENEGALDEYGNALEGTTDRDKLALSQDFTNNYAMTPEEEQGIVDAASQTTAGQYRKMADQAKMRAAAQGNTSPAALAAIEQQLGREGAAEGGDAATRAKLQANTERANRLRDIEGMRLGTEQDLSTRGQQNSGNIYGARSSGARDLATMEQQGISDVTSNRLKGAQSAADLDYAAELAGGQARTNAASNAAKYNYDAEAGASDADYRAADSGGKANMEAVQYGSDNRQKVATGNQQTGQGLATAADTSRVNRTAGIADKRIAGQQGYRDYLTGQQARQQQGGQNADSNQINTFGTQGGLQSQSTGQAIQGQTAQNSIDKQPGEGERIGMGLVKAFFADGGVVTEPTMGVVGENGPERVVKLGPGRSRFPRYGMSAAC
jgi:hypothetical protein